MDKTYILSIDQSTQGTKALLFDQNGDLVCKSSLPHKQLINEQGWVSHDLEEIFQNTIHAVKNVVEKALIDKRQIAGLGITNQRETSAVWDRRSGKPVAPAVVWQCSRAKDICEQIEKQGYSDMIREHTGIPPSPYFPASKLSWLLKNTCGAKELQQQGNLGLGTIDTWILYRLTKGKVYKTDYSNASRTQLFNIHTLRWDHEICRIFGLQPEELAEVCDSNAIYGETDFEGYLEKPIPICSVLGDSHGALFGQGCLSVGTAKATYGTGSSVMMNVGMQPILSKNGLVTSLAWGIDGNVPYVLEGNINYTGAVISWLIKDLNLIASSAETEALAKSANSEDGTYLVPAFTGLGAPYWNSNARAVISGISRTTGKRELVKAALESIAYQITDVVEAMERDAETAMQELHVDGAPTNNSYLMQFQSDIAQIPILLPEIKELSGMGAAYMAGLTLGIYDKTVFNKVKRHRFLPQMASALRNSKYNGWKYAVNKAT